MESREQIKKKLKDKYGVEPTSDSDFTQLPDEILANVHLYDWIDKVSIQAGVEMSRRLKTAVQNLEKTIVNLDGKNEKLQKRIFWLTVVGLIFTATQIVQVLEIVKTWLR
jgi:hypothetical protein